MMLTRDQTEEICELERANGKLRQALDVRAREVMTLASRLREMCALMQHDIDEARVTATDTRKMVMEEARTAVIKLS